MAKWVYMFSEGDASMRNTLGGKGANLAEMTKIIGADVVPQGFTIITDACTRYYEDGRTTVSYTHLTLPTMAVV